MEFLNESSSDINYTINETSSALHEFGYYELALWFFLYGTIAFLAVFGNLLVIYVIVSRPRMQTVTNYFIVNLAAADALTGICSEYIQNISSHDNLRALKYFPIKSNLGVNEEITLLVFTQSKPLNDGINIIL